MAAFSHGIGERAPTLFRFCVCDRIITTQNSLAPAAVRKGGESTLSRREQQRGVKLIHMYDGNKEIHQHCRR